MTTLHPWLEPYSASLVAALEQGRFPHALLLSGQPGMGKAAFAEYIAALLLCESPAGSQAPCGHCPGCVQFDAGSHPDYFFVEPEEDSAVIKIDQVRELAARLSLSSHRGGYKVAVLHPAESMNINAANSLLKTLEEPSDNTVLVLVCTHPAHLPPTIRSRCQQIRIAAPDRELARSWLSVQLPDQDMEVYLHLANGAPLEALRQAREGRLEERRERFQALVGILDGRTSPLTVAQAWSKDEDLQGIRWLRDWLMDLLRIRMTGQGRQLRSVDLADALSRLAQRLDSRVMFDQLAHINRTLRLTAASSLNRQLMTEDILLAWAAQK
jgi:DNA polymerase-3 subunit delta'